MRTSRALAKQIVATYAERALRRRRGRRRRRRRVRAARRGAAARSRQRSAARRAARRLGRPAPSARRSRARCSRVCIRRSSTRWPSWSSAATSTCFRAWSRSTATIAEEKRGVVAVDVTTAVELSESLRRVHHQRSSPPIWARASSFARRSIPPSSAASSSARTGSASTRASRRSSRAARVVLSTAHTGGEA